jgi:hypothetical protein
MPRWKRRGTFLGGGGTRILRVFTGETPVPLFVNLDAFPAVNELAFLEGCFEPIMRSERISLLGRHLLSTMR